MEERMLRTDCFAFWSRNGRVKCEALQRIDCMGCKFYKTQEEYDKKVKPLKYKKNKI